MYNRLVRRLLALVVLSIVGFLPIGGTVSSVTAHGAQLPACCRTSGKHKCAMHSGNDAPVSSAAQRGMYSVCGQYPATQPATFAVLNVSVFPPADSELIHAAVVGHLCPRFEGAAPVTGRWERGHLKRGPPTFLS